MPIFSYEAVDAQGVTRSGEIDCPTRLAAIEGIHQKGLVPIEIAPRAPSALSSVWARITEGRGRKHSRIDTLQLLSFTESLAALLRAGLTIDRALGIAASLSKDSQVRPILEQLGQSVRSGKSFAESLATTQISLPPYYIGMVQAGELGGTLPQTLTRLAELLRNQHQVRERVRSALIYPAMLGIVVFATIVLMITFVLPRFQALFAESQAPLPWMTRAVLAVGEVVTQHWLSLTLLFSALIVVATMLVRTPAGRDRIDRWLLNSRLTLGLPAAIESARLLRTLSTLLANGVQIGGALRTARATLSNRWLQRGLDAAALRIKAGESTSAAFAAANVFPLQAVQLARVGEETGRLEELLLQAATILEDESQRTLERLLTMLVPALTIVMGLIIAGLIGSVLIGLLSVNELAF